MSTLSELLNRLSISDVFWIDDENAAASDLDLEKLVSQLAEQLAQNDETARKKSLGTFRRHQSLRSVADKVENILKEEEPDIERVESALGLGLKNFGDPKTVVEAALAALPQVLSSAQKEALKRVFGGSSAEFVAMSFAEWGTKGSEILERFAYKKNGCLLVLDLQNTRESAPIDGEAIISQWAAEVSRAVRSLPIYVVALTSSVRQKEELVEGRRLAHEGFLGARVRIPIVVLSKDRLSNDEDSVETSFISSLARLRTFNLHQQLAKDLSEAFVSATAEAFESLEQLTIEEFIYAVSTSSLKEGASEVETLTRLVSIAHKRALVKRLSQHKSARRVLMEMRGLHVENEPTLKLDDLLTRDGILRLRQSEQFESGEIVNNMFAPISCGDLFDVVLSDGRRGHFVIISNACDLMLRSDGTRKLEHALLVRLADSAVVGNQLSVESLATACRVTGVLEPLVVPMLTLDLCWTNKRGLSKWAREPSIEWQKYRDLLPAQEARYQVLQREFSREGARWLWSLAPTIKLRAKLNDTNSVNRVAFRMQRLGRLSLDLSNQFVDDFVRATARPASLHDFAGSKNRS